MVTPHAERHRDTSGPRKGPPEVRRGAWRAVAIFLAGAGCCHAATAASTTQPADAPPLQYEIADAKSGRVLSTVWGWTEPLDTAPENVVAVSQISFAQGGEWRIRAVFTRDHPPRCLSWEGTLSDADGALVAFNHARWVGDLFPLLDKPLPPDAYPMEAPMGYVLTRLGLGAEKQKSFHTVFGGSLAQVDVWIDGREVVQVPAGRFDCHRVRMRANAQSLFPNLPAFLRPVLSFFIPTYTVWLTVDEPQIFVQFKGQMGPPGSPELRVRLLMVGQGPD